MRNTVLQPIAPMCVAGGDSETALTFPARSLALIWRALKATEDEAIEKVRHILDQRRASLEALTARLMDVESVDADELQRIIEQNSPIPLVVPGTEAPFRLAPPEPVEPAANVAEKSG